VNRLTLSGLQTSPLTLLGISGSFRFFCQRYGSSAQVFSLPRPNFLPLLNRLTWCLVTPVLYSFFFSPEFACTNVFLIEDRQSSNCFCMFIPPCTMSLLLYHPPFFWCFLPGRSSWVRSDDNSELVLWYDGSKIPSWSHFNFHYTSPNSSSGGTPVPASSHFCVRESIPSPFVILSKYAPHYTLVFQLLFPDV